MDNNPLTLTSRLLRLLRPVIAYVRDSRGYDRPGTERVAQRAVRAHPRLFRDLRNRVRRHVHSTPDSPYSRYLTRTDTELVADLGFLAAFSNMAPGGTLPPPPPEPVFTERHQRILRRIVGDILKDRLTPYQIEALSRRIARRHPDLVQHLRDTDRAHADWVVEYLPDRPTDVDLPVLAGLEDWQVIYQKAYETAQGLWRVHQLRNTQ